MPWRFLHMETHFDLVKANFIRCEECNENFFFDFLRHPRYFVTHFKSCHLKNLLYRFNGLSEEENARVRFGPRRKKDANHWFGQLKSTEKRMISMQDNKWSEISERDCWSCRLCNDGKADVTTHVFELSDLGRSQAFLHLRTTHERIYDAFLSQPPMVDTALDGQQTQPTQQLPMPMPLGLPNRMDDAALLPQTRLPPRSLPPPPLATPPANAPNALLLAPIPLPDPATQRSAAQRTAEAERSRLRRQRATDDVRHMEAQRSKRRRERLTPAQRQADYERRKRKQKRLDESQRSRERREHASDAARERELLRSRERRRTASDDQRKREAERSRKRRELASDAQRLKERERCRKRYELQRDERQRRSGSCHSSEAGGGEQEAVSHNNHVYEDQRDAHEAHCSSAGRAIDGDACSISYNSSGDNIVYSISGSGAGNGVEDSHVRFVAPPAMTMPIVRYDALDRVWRDGSGDASAIHDSTMGGAPYAR